MSISFINFTDLFSYDLKNEYSIEILFSVKSFDEYQYCWMGKMPNENIVGTYIYWLGLGSDGKYPYDFSSFDELCVAPVFNGKRLVDVYPLIEFIEIDGCDPESRILFYLSNK